jgi:hypothetical protein
MSGILPDMPPHLELVDEDFVPSPLPGTPLYGPPVTIPVAGVAEYWQGVFERNDPAELERIAAAYATVTPSIGPAPDREETAPESRNWPRPPRRLLRRLRHLLTMGRPHDD